MALSRALFSGISGLKGQQLKLDVIGNNIANVNTIGFKKSRVTFSDLFSDTLSMGASPSDALGGTNPSQVGLGAATPKIEILMTDGVTQTTGIGTDLAINGDGFFIVGDGFNQVYTRDGNFKLDDNGDLVTGSSSLRTQGWMAVREDNGSFYVDQNSGLTDINLQENRKMWAVATDFIGYSSNLNSGSSERSIAQAEKSLHFKDNSSPDPLLQGSQKITFGFQMLDGNNYSWVANDTNGSTIATGSLKFNDFGEILESKMYGAGSTNVNYDWNDMNFPDIFTFSSKGQIDPNATNQNIQDGLSDMVFNPNAEDFMALSKLENPKAFSFTYDPDGDYIPGKWLNPNSPQSLSSESKNLYSTTIAPAAAMIAKEYNIKNLVVNNSWDNEVKGNTLQIYNGAASTLTTSQIRVEIVNSVDGNPNKMDVVIYKNNLGGGVGTETKIGHMFALDRDVAEHKITIPGIMSFFLNKSDVTASNLWPNSTPTGSDIFFDVGNSGNLNPTDNNNFFTGLPMGFHDGAGGPSKFEIRNIDASNSDYTGGLRLIFTSPTSYQIIDDNNVVLSTNSLRDEQRDVQIEVLGIKMVIHREGNSLRPKDLLENGFTGTEIRISGFQKAEGKSEPVTVSVPKFSEINENGVILKAESDLNFDVGFSKAEPLMRRNLTGGLQTLNNTYPEATVTIDASRADSSANGVYRIEISTRNVPVAPAATDPYRPHITNTPFTPANSDELDNQVLKVYIDGSSTPAYVIDLNPKFNNTAAPITIGGIAYPPGAQLPLLDQNGDPLLNSNFMPAYNFFAEMENYDANVAGGTQAVSNTFLNQYDMVRRQINLPNGVVINMENISSAGEVGTNSSSAFTKSANFVCGDSFNFTIDKAGQKAGLEEIGTYSATFQNGAMHSTTIEVFDSLGGSHFITTTFEHVNKNSREWNYYLSLDSKDPLIQDFLKNPPAGYTVVDPKQPTEEELRKANEFIFSSGRQGKIYFNQGGVVDRFNSHIPKAMFKPVDANMVELSLDMDLITQFEADFSTAAKERNGNTMGVLQGFTIESDGKIIGSYTNGQKAPIAQIAVAIFNNPEGLMRNGSNTFTSTTTSGLARISAAGNDGRGLIKSGTLESSNVDLTDEFTELIVTQRSFSANGRIITTSDEFLQEILSLKR